MTTVKNILDWFESFAPLRTAMDFDNCGLLAGDENAEVSGVLASLDITAEVVREAREKGCELIISHHPVIFNPLKRLSRNSAPYLLAEYGINAVCMHTNLDLSEVFGVNTCLAEACGVKGLRKSERGECLFIGELENETPIGEYALFVKKALGCDGLRYTSPKATVRRIAVSSGSGGSNIFDAAAEGADVLIAGEVEHHEINAGNELGVCVIEAGHFKSEDIVIIPLIERLKAEFPEISFTKSSAYSDFMKYI